MKILYKKFDQVILIQIKNLIIKKENKSKVIYILIKNFFRKKGNFQK